MVLLVRSHVVIDDHARLRPPAPRDRLPRLGFGLIVPTLNTLDRGVPPRPVDRSVLLLNALLGLGTALAPVFVAVFVGLGFWWGLPVFAVVLLALLVLVSLPLPLLAWSLCRCAVARCSRAGIPTRFWMFAGFAVSTASARR